MIAAVVALHEETPEVLPEVDQLDFAGMARQANDGANLHTL